MVAAALLDTVSGGVLAGVDSALDLPDVVVDQSDTARRHQATAVELGLQLVSHFTSDGRHDLADIYQQATTRLSAPR